MPRGQREGLVYPEGDPGAAESAARALQTIGGRLSSVAGGLPSGAPASWTGHAASVYTQSVSQVRAGLSAGSIDNQAPWQIMATVMAAGMVPPLAMALATVLDKKLFSLAERENGKAAWLLGASFISEGAIPFAAADPLRVIPASMLGGALTGALTMAFGVTSQAPHGGIFVFFAIGNVLMFVLSIIAGTIVTALAVVALKRWAAPKTADTVENVPATV